MQVDVRGTLYVMGDKRSTEVPARVNRDQYLWFPMSLMMCKIASLGTEITREASGNSKTDFEDIAKEVVNEYLGPDWGIVERLVQSGPSRWNGSGWGPIGGNDTVLVWPLHHNGDEAVIGRHVVEGPPSVTVAIAAAILVQNRR
ncbi:MAG: hypothetical protein Phyf2KO_11350 [Phycisphaerales bacterium]